MILTPHIQPPLKLLEQQDQFFSFCYTLDIWDLKMNTSWWIRISTFISWYLHLDVTKPRTWYLWSPLLICRCVLCHCYAAWWSSCRLDWMHCSINWQILSSSTICPFHGLILKVFSKGGLWYLHPALWRLLMLPIWVFSF